MRFHFISMCTNAEIVAVASPTPGKAAHFAKEHGIPNAFDNYRDLLALKEIDVITVAIPNDLHAQVTIDAARAGKHVICEKPLCNTLEEADQMIDECRKHGVLLLYAEELFSRRSTSAPRRWSTKAPLAMCIWSSTGKSTTDRTCRGSGTSSDRAAA